MTRTAFTMIDGVPSPTSIGINMLLINNDDIEIGVGGGLRTRDLRISPEPRRAIPFATKGPYESDAPPS